jgi:hypothetical protein
MHYPVKVKTAITFGGHLLEVVLIGEWTGFGHPSFWYLTAMGDTQFNRCVQCTLIGAGLAVGYDFFQWHEIILVKSVTEITFQIYFQCIHCVKKLNML